MGKIFNVSGACDPDWHYMVDITDKLTQIQSMVDAGQYFIINRARQYGKTTTLRELEKILKRGYIVVSLDFQMLGAASFQTENIFSLTFARIFLRAAQRQKDENTDRYRQRLSAFQSVILAGVYDVKNLKRKFVSEDGHKLNSPWNIAADFLVDMSFSEKEILGMLKAYEADAGTGMDIRAMAGLLYDYTSGYPFLVSRICKLLDERVAGSGAFPDKRAAWTREGGLEAVHLLLSEKNTLFESLTGKLKDHPDLRDMLFALLFQGRVIPYDPDDEDIDVALMFGFVKIGDAGSIIVANRIFEMRLYNLFLASASILTKRNRSAFLRSVSVIRS